MAKRLTDCEKWTKLWFRKLTPIHKCFWVYVCDKCDHVGVWEVDFEMASLYIGAPLNIEEIKAVFSKQFVELNCGSKWLIKDFLYFQYGSMDETNKMFKTIETSLNRYGLKMGDIWGINPLKVTVKEKVKVIVKDKEQEKAQFGEFVYLTNEEYRKLTVKWGQPKLDLMIESLNNGIGAKGYKYKSHYHALLTWAKRETINPITTPSMNKTEEAKLFDKAKAELGRMAKPENIAEWLKKLPKHYHGMLRLYICKSFTDGDQAYTKAERLYATV